LPTPLDDRKKTKFFVFTDWQPGQARATDGLDRWIPFNDPAGKALELCEIRKNVNIRVDRMLVGHILEDNRVYFSHLNRGVELIENGPPPDWKYMQGAIVESEATSTQRGHGEALERLADGLAANAPDYFVWRIKRLVCLLPARGLLVEDKFKPDDMFQIKQTATVQELIDGVSIWLIDANKHFNDDRKGHDVEIRRQVDEVLNQFLG
jgi:hypothetical protein